MERYIPANILIGKKLKFLRVKKGLQQIEAAELIGCSSAALSRYESGARVPSKKMLNDICIAYEVSMSFFLDK